MASLGHPQQRQFNPYSDNGGTILAIAGENFTVIAGDTRQSEGYSIQTRYAPKVFRLYVLHISAQKARADVCGLQNRQGGARGEWVRCRWKYVCEEGQAEAGGAFCRRRVR